MPDFSVIAQDPTVRQIVQENMLNRQFHDALFPKLLFRGEATPELWAANVGDVQLFTGVGLMDLNMAPLKPGVDPVPASYPFEQWQAQMQLYANTIDTPMPTSMVAIANLFLRNAQQLGLNAGMSLNRITRDKMYNAALSGQTVVDGAGQNSATIRVKRLNGLCRARRPDLVAGSPVRFDPVSSSNPLKVTFGGIVGVKNIIAATPDTAGDEIGPGTVTIAEAAIAPADRAAVASYDASVIVRVGGGTKVDDIGNTDLLRLQDIRTAVARARTQNIPEMPDGRFHFHLDPTSETQIYADDEFQRLLTALPDHYIYKAFTIGEMLGCVFFRNNEAPIPDTVGNKTGTGFSQGDPFAGELTNDGAAVSGSNVVIHRPLLVGQDGILEKYSDMGLLVTDAGITGKLGTFSITNNGIDVMTDRIQLILRAPQDRLQQMVAASWKFMGDWPVRTDAATGDAARYKRFVAIEHGTGV